MKLITEINKCNQANVVLDTQHIQMYKGLCCCDMFYKSVAHLGEGLREPPLFGGQKKMQTGEKPAGQLITWNLNTMFFFPLLTAVVKMLIIKLQSQSYMKKCSLVTK